MVFAGLVFIFKHWFYFVMGIKLEVGKVDQLPLFDADSSLTTPLVEFYQVSAMYCIQNSDV